MSNLTLAIGFLVISAPVLVRMAIKDKASIQIWLGLALAVGAVWFLDTPTGYQHHKEDASYRTQKIRTR